MNKTFIFLSLSNFITNGPFFTLSSNNRRFSLDFSEFKRFSQNFLFSNSLHQNYISIKKSKFYDFLTNSIRIENSNSNIPEIIRNRTIFSKEYQLEITETIFGRNKNHLFDYDGGAIYVELSTVLLSKCQFIDNFVTSSGGAIRIERCLNSTISYCLFARNAAIYVGGAAVLSSVFDVQLNDSNFTKNFCDFDAASIAFLMCDRINPVSCFDYSSNTSSNSCAWLFNNGDFEIGICFYCNMNNPAIKTNLYASGSIFSSTFQKFRTYAIDWCSPFTGTIQECIFDADSDKAIRIHNYFGNRESEEPTIDQCSFQISLKDSEIEKRIVQIKYDFNDDIINNNENISIPIKKKKKYPKTFINIQNIPGDDTFNNYNKPNMFPFILSFISSLILLQGFNYWLRTRTFISTNGEYTQLNIKGNGEFVSPNGTYDQGNDIGAIKDYEKQQFDESLRYETEKSLDKLQDLPLSTL